jgi:hypothetical protein
MRKKTPLRGLRFESLDEAQRYLDRWEAHWADTRIHGTMIETELFGRRAGLSAPDSLPRESIPRHRSEGKTHATKLHRDVGNP